MKRLVSLLLAGLVCASLLAPLAPPAAAKDTTPAAAGAPEPIRCPDARAPRELSEADRQELQRAQQSSDPELQTLRGGHLGLLLLILLIVILI